MQLGVIYDLQEWRTSESGDIWREMAPVGPILVPFLPPLPLAGANFTTNFVAIPATYIPTLAFVPPPPLDGGTNFGQNFAKPMILKPVV